MKRSEIDKLIDEAIAFLNEANFTLPEWACWTRRGWSQKLAETKRVRELKLGWDVTDFGSGDFYKQGLLLFTIRNGIVGNSDYNKGYAEKVMLPRRGQVTPYHYHVQKTEDIINRCGGEFKIKFCKAEKEAGLAKGRFKVYIDEVERELGPEEVVSIKPGQSVTMEPYIYHEFWTPDEMVLVGEVSSVNDDETDNHFYKEVKRFSQIEEDVAGKYYLCNEYPE